MSCLTAWRLPKSPGWQKKVQKHDFSNIRPLKMSGEKKFMYKPRMSIQKENLKSKPRQNWLEKGLFFGVTLIQAVVSKTLVFFT